MVAALAVGEEGLLPVGGPLHRPAELPGREERQDLLGVEEDLHAEAAADVRRDQLQLIRLDPEDGAELRLQAEDALVAAVERQAAAVGIARGDGAARLQGVDHDAIVDQLDARNLGSCGEGLGGAGLVAMHPVEAEVPGGLGMHHRRVGVERAVGIHQRRQCLEVELHQLGGVAGLIEGLGDDEDDRVADVAHPPAGEHRTRRHESLAAAAARHGGQARHGADAGRREVGACQDGQDPGRLLRRFDIQPGDGGVGEGAPHDGAIGLSCEIDVIGIAALAGEQSSVLDASHGLADAELSHVRGAPFGRTVGSR